MEYILEIILATGLWMIIVQLKNIAGSISVIREHTHNTHLRLISIDQYVEKAVQQYTTTY